MNLFLHDSKNWIFPVWLTELNLFFFWKRLTELNLFSLNMTKELDSYFLNITQGIEHLISWIWRKELNRLIFEYTQRIELFLHKDSKNWYYFWKTPRIQLVYMTQRMELFLNLTHSFDLFKKKWLKEMNFFFFRYHSKNWTL